MRAVIKSGPGKGFDYQPGYREPEEPGAGEVLIEVAAASLCGTDREIFEDTPSAQAFNLSTPVVVGHEGSGTVRAVGAGVTGLAPGDLVAIESHLWCGQCRACRMGNSHACPSTRIVGMHRDGLFAEQVVLPEQVCVKLPPSISLDVGALMESAGVAVHAIQRTDYSVAGRAVLVNGCGPVGLVTGEIARIMGATVVVAADPNPFRRGQAADRGFTAIDPLTSDIVTACRDLTGGQGVDVGFEASGARGVLSSVLESLTIGGTAVTIGHPSEPPEINVAALINKRGITLRGIYGRRLWTTWEMLVDLLASGRLELDWLVTHRFGLHDVNAAVELLSGDAGKVLLDPTIAPGNSQV